MAHDVVDPDEAPTLVNCPACDDCLSCDGHHLIVCPQCGEGHVVCGACASCSFCLGRHMVTPTRAAEWRASQRPPSSH